MLDLTGQRFGKLVAINLAGRGNRGCVWRLICDCGNETTAYAYKLREGRKVSCGCARIKTGKYTLEALGKSRLWGVLMEMRKRCYCTTSKDYPHYGAKGVAICREWQDPNVFEKWALANGYQEGLTIDRIDSAGNYEPTNCQWISNSENARKQRHNVITEQRKTA